MTMRNPNSIDSRRHESAARLDTAFARCGSRSSYGRRQSPRPTADGWLSLSCGFPFCDSSYHGRWGMSGVKFPNGYVGNNGNYGKTDAGCECEVADG